jgi:hypothetical protein
MEISQRNSLYSYLYLKQTVMSCFSFDLFSFFLCKIKEQEGRTGPVQGGELVSVEAGRRVNTGKIMCTCACNCNIDTWCNYSEGEIEGEQWRV